MSCLPPTHTLPLLLLPITGRNVRSVPSERKRIWGAFIPQGLPSILQNIRCPGLSSVTPSGVFIPPFPLLTHNAVQDHLGKDMRSMAFQSMSRCIGWHFVLSADGLLGKLGGSPSIFLFASVSQVLFFDLECPAETLGHDIRICASSMLVVTNHVLANTQLVRKLGLRQPGL